MRIVVSGDGWSRLKGGLKGRWVKTGGGGLLGLWWKMGMDMWHIRIPVGRRNGGGGVGGGIEVSVDLRGRSGGRIDWKKVMGPKLEMGVSRLRGG